MEKPEKLHNVYDVELPQSVIESFAKLLLPQIRTFYSSPEGKQSFKEWQERKEKDDT